MSQDSTDIILGLFGTVVVFGQILLILLILLYILHKTNKKNKQLKFLFDFISQNSLVAAFFVSASATFGSLFLSEIAKIPPCMLCWYQRIFMFPQVILLGIALFKNEETIKKYVIALSVIGAVIAAYHFLLQRVPTLPLPCTNDVVSCATKQIELFGYLTIPLMSLTAFLLIILILLISYKRNRG